MRLKLSYKNRSNNIRLKFNGFVSLVHGLLVAHVIEYITVEHFDGHVIATSHIGQVLVDQLNEAVQVLAAVLNTVN